MKYEQLTDGMFIKINDPRDWHTEWKIHPRYKVTKRNGSYYIDQPIDDTRFSGHKYIVDGQTIKFFDIVSLVTRERVEISLP